MKIKIKTQFIIESPLQVMLVVICGIRKMVECIFTKRELRLLDDLLPESNKQQRRRASHRPGSRKSKRKDLDIEDIDVTIGTSKNKRYSKRNKKEASEVDLYPEYDQAHYSRKAITLEPRPISPSLPPYPKKDVRIRTEGRRSKEVPDSVYSSQSKKKNPRRDSLDPRSLHPSYKVKKRRESQPKKLPKFCIYVKLDNQKIFTPLHLEKKTLSSLLQSLETKFGIEEFEASKIDKTYQMNKKKFVFHLDDDMMEYIQSHEVFNIELSEVTAEDETIKFNMTLMEME
jgi:hypothetical protein